MEEGHGARRRLVYYLELNLPLSSYNYKKFHDDNAKACRNSYIKS